MRVKSISHLRRSLTDDLDRVAEDQVPLIVTRSNGRQPAVIIPAEWLERWQGHTSELETIPEN